MKLAADTAVIERRRPQAKSRISNGSAVFFDGVDGRSVVARRYRDVLTSLISDMGGDPSEAQNLIARRSATLAVWCELAEARMAKGDNLDIAEFTTATNALRRLLADIGLERRARDLTPSVDAYLARVAADEKASAA
jgi:hypothetical protein